MAASDHRRRCFFSKPTTERRFPCRPIAQRSGASGLALLYCRLAGGRHSAFEVSGQTRRHPNPIMLLLSPDGSDGCVECGICEGSYRHDGCFGARINTPVNRASALGAELKFDFAATIRGPRAGIATTADLEVGSRKPCVDGKHAPRTALTGLAMAGRNEKGRAFADHRQLPAGTRSRSFHFSLLAFEADLSGRRACSNAASLVITLECPENDGTLGIDSCVSSIIRECWLGYRGRGRRSDALLRRMNRCPERHCSSSAVMESNAVQYRFET
jgi:hypothetical protein